MGMSTHVQGFRPPDDKWKAMKAIWDACEAAKVPPPAAVAEFFGHTAPDPAGVEVNIERTPACRPWSDESRSGFEVDVSKLPPGLTIVRFYNSY
jgi:hypothetical protein